MTLQGPAFGVDLEAEDFPQSAARTGEALELAAEIDSPDLAVEAADVQMSADRIPGNAFRAQRLILQDEEYLRCCNRRHVLQHSLSALEPTFVVARQPRVSGLYVQVDESRPLAER